MVRHTLEYSKEEHNTVNRYKHQGMPSNCKYSPKADIALAVYSLETIHTIVNTTPVLHVSFTPSPNDTFPVILPLIGQMGSFTHPSNTLSDPLDLYLHGYVSSRIMNLSRSSPKGLPLCVCASKVDGLVLSLTPNSHNYNYRSAVLFGHATLVENTEEKLWAMELITNSVVPDRWRHTRVPPVSAFLL